VRAKAALLFGLGWFAALAHADVAGEREADLHSNANIDQFLVTHIELILDVQMAFRQLQGSVVLEYKRLDPRATELVLDTRDLNIRDVSQLSTDFVGATESTKPFWVNRPYRVGKANANLGSALYIDLPASTQPVQAIKIEYETSPTAAGLRWRVPPKGSHKIDPFMWSHSAPLGARSWIPLQDTPQVRATFRAHIEADDGLLAVMGVRNDPKVKRNGVYVFTSQKAIPSFLISLAAGMLEFKPEGTRAGVYAEKAGVKAAAKEFADVEAMLAAAEKILGTYPFERFDVLVMPANFPAAVEANPGLAFVSPTIIAGDKSLVSTLANGVAHSWSGNLVTNATWRDRWLNDAFAAYLQGRIMTAVYGEPREKLEEVLDLRVLREAMRGGQAQDQILAADLSSPQERPATRELMYEKGRLFLNYLDAKFGRERFDEFLRGYFEHFAWQSVSTGQFLEYLQQNLLDRFPGIVTAAAASVWVLDPGLPADAVLPDSADTAVIDKAREAWINGSLSASQLGARAWLGTQWRYFLALLPQGLPATQLAELDKAYSLTVTPDAEIARSWLEVAIADNYRPAFPRIEEYLRTVGRYELIAPLYVELMKTSAGTDLAKKAFGLAHGGYDTQVAKDLEAIVGPVPVSVEP
jgi:aminopeptidase N